MLAGVGVHRLVIGLLTHIILAVVGVLGLVLWLVILSLCIKVAVVGRVGLALGVVMLSLCLCQASYWLGWGCCS